MGVLIKSVGVSENRDGSSIDNAVSAARRCLDQANVLDHHIDLLINVGVYRDDNIMEPSIAALIQQKLQINPDPVKNDIHARTFSFDLMNGACGLLNAVEVAASFMETGVYRNVLVVGGDIHPSRSVVEGFPFSSVGGAVLLEYTQDDRTGFGRVSAHTAANNDFYGYRVQGALSDFGTAGRQHAVITSHPQYRDHFCSQLSENVQHFLNEQNVPYERIDALITSQLESGFPRQLATDIGLKVDVIAPDLAEQWGDPHTAAPMLCVDAMIQQQQLQPGSLVLFALVGSGIATTCALYQVPA